MSDPKKADLDDSSLLVTLTVGQLKTIVWEESQKAAGQNAQQGDKLLDAEAACKDLSVSPDWLYRNAKRLPFTRISSTEKQGGSGDGSPSKPTQPV